MMNATDRRPNHVAKRATPGRIRKAGYEPVLAIENSERVAAMYREAGLRVLLVEAD